MHNKLTSGFDNLFPASVAPLSPQFTLKMNSLEHINVTNLENYIYIQLKVKNHYLKHCMQCG